METFEFALECNVCGHKHCFSVEAASIEEAQGIAEEMMLQDHEGVAIRICNEAEAIFPA